MNSARATALPGEAAARWRDAEEGARRCLALDQRRAECHAILGQARRQAGDERGAVAALDEAARQAPQVLRYRVSLADLYAQIEEFERAVAVLRDGLKLAPEADPERSAALLALGSSLQATGALPEALATLEQARQADREGKNQEILFALATVHASLQPPRRQEALQLFKAFMVRMCKGSRAALHVRQCEAAQVGALTMGAGLE
jgi:tetratricopeptide (TPR) repeat protein